jgi:magnesium transporter
MADAATLSLAFMRDHPAEAARVLEAVPAGQAAALFDRVPGRLGAPVLGAMLPGVAARSLGELGDERTMELLSALGTQSSVAVLRHIAEPRRSRLIAGLPTTAALASRLMLGFPEDTVGAWTDPDVVTLGAETRASDALQRVRHAESVVLRIFVTDAAQRLIGWVPLAALLRAPDGASLGAVMSRPDAVLGAHAPLAGAAIHPGWERASVLPVVTTGDRLLGVLSRDALTRALRRTTRQASAPGDDTLMGMMARGYWEALSGLVEAVATLLPSVKPIGGARDER